MKQAQGLREPMFHYSTISKTLKEAREGKTFINDVFHPHLFYDEVDDKLFVVLKNCPATATVISKHFSVCWSKDLRAVGFILFGARKMLRDQEYKKSSIALDRLLIRFDKYYAVFQWPFGVFSPFGTYGTETWPFLITQKQQFVWHLPK